MVAEAVEVEVEEEVLPSPRSSLVAVRVVVAPYSEPRPAYRELLIPAPAETPPETSLRSSSRPPSLSEAAAISTYRGDANEAD